MSVDSGPENRVAAIVLAAGAARRFGRPKQLEQWPSAVGPTLVERAVGLTLAATAGPVLVVVGNQQKAVEEVLARQVNSPRVKPVFNPRWEEGQGFSVAAGVKAANELVPPVEGALIMLTDQPRLRVETLKTLLEQFAGLGEAGREKILFPVFEGKRGNPVIFGRNFFEELTRLEGDVGGRAVVRKYPQAIIEVAVTDPAIHEDVDTPEELAKLLDTGGEG
ncbi:MAG: nucleotidyltransferase family protein [Chloroflexi bacterium]|nr:nucleotidyltransferase family protein [Chloroflexota bacterium]